MLKTQFFILQTNKECIKEGILKKFLLENRREVPSMSILYEFDEELHNRTMQEIAREEGAKTELNSIIKNMLREKQSPEFISKMTGKTVGYVYQIQEEMLSVVSENAVYNLKPNGKDN